MISATELRNNKNPCRVEHLQNLDQLVRSAHRSNQREVTVHQLHDPKLLHILHALGYHTTTNSTTQQTTVYW